MTHMQAIAAVISTLGTSEDDERALRRLTEEAHRRLKPRPLAIKPVRPM